MIEALLILAGVLAGSGVGLAVGVKLRGLIPLRAPSNRVRLENARADAEIDVARAKADLEAAQARAGVERVELEQTYSRAVAALEVSKIQGFEARAADDVDVLLRARRSDMGLSQRQVAQMCRMRPQRVSAIENGESPTHAELAALALALHLELIPARLARKVPVEAAPFLRGLPASSVDGEAVEEAADA